jgi:DNA-binding MarR family transcriptional regulator
LVKKSLCQVDGRVTYAVLTEKGRQKLSKASRSHGVAVRTLFEARYSRAELATLAELLERLPGVNGRAPLI